MKKLIERLLLFFLGLPLLVASVFFLPYQNYLFFHIEMLVFGAFAIIEMRALLSTRLAVLPLPASLIISLIVPATASVVAIFNLSLYAVFVATAIACILILVWEFFASLSGVFEDSAGRIASSFTVLIYPSSLITYLCALTTREHAGAFLSVFFLMVFMCDSLAWFFGMLLGRGNRGLIPASPNKSVAGFIGGYAGSILAAFIGVYLFEDVFGGKLAPLVITGVLTATMAIIGDIIESILKRSTGVKDSGTLIPGRGGVLDSIDSVLLAAPVFYILTESFFG
jgi:phosphatidate cytidylyltransferase